MSLLLRQATKRTLCSGAAAAAVNHSNKQALLLSNRAHFNHRNNNTSSSSATATATATAAAASTILVREFSAAKKKQTVNGDIKNNNELSYQERKDLAKQIRREMWEKKQNRLERLKTRRDHSPKDVKKTLFRSWWDKELMYHDKLIRLAKKEGRPWRIRVAVMVERLPVVTPDVDEWEREYLDLRDYLMTFGKEYPAETGFMFAPDKPEDHIVESDEELLCKFLYVWD